MKRLVLGILLFPVLFSVAQASSQSMQKPKGCIEHDEFPCSVWVFNKTHFPTPGVQIFAGADALFEVRKDSIYHIRGKLWVVSDRSYTVQNRFGEVKSEGKGEIWSEASDEKFLVRSFSNSLSVVPRGGVPQILAGGFEISLSYVNRDTRSAEYSGPYLFNLHSQVKALRAVLESDDLFKEKVTKLATVVLSAAPVAAEASRYGLTRQVASVEKEETRQKQEKAKTAGRDSYLRKLFLRKSNFEE